MSGSSGDTLRSFLVSIAYQEQGREKFLGNLVIVTNQAVQLGKSIAQAAVDVTKAVAVIASSLDGLYFASMRIGASVASIKSIQFALSNLGGSAEGALSTLENMGRFLRTNPGSEGFIQSLGVATRDANGKIRDTGDLLVDLKGKLDLMPSYVRPAFAGVFGMDEKTMLASTSDMREMQKTSRDMYSAAGLDAKKASEDSHLFTVELNTLNLAFQVLGEKVASVLTKQMSDDIRRFRVWLVSNFDTIGRAIVWIFERFRELAGIVEYIAIKMGDMARSLGAGFAALTPEAQKAIGVLAAVAASIFVLNFVLNASPLMRLVYLGFAIAALAEDYEGWKRTGGKGSLIDWAKWEPAIEAAKKGILSLRDAICKSLIPALLEFGKELGLLDKDNGEDFAAGLSKGIERFTKKLNEALLGMTRLVRLASAIARGDIDGAVNIAREISAPIVAATGGALNSAADPLVGPGQSMTPGQWLNNLFTGKNSPGEGNTSVGRFLSRLMNFGTSGNAAARRILHPGGSAAGGVGAIPIAQRAGILAQATAGTPVPPAVMDALFMQESQWNPRNQRAGGSDLGLGQITASTGAQPGYGMEPISREDAMDPMKASRWSTLYLYQKAKANGMKDEDWTDPAKVAGALTMYNGGGDPNYAAHVMNRLPSVASQRQATTPSTDFERTLHIAPGALRGLGAGTPLGGGSNDNSTTHAPVLNQNTTINMNGVGADVGRQVMEGQRSINQDNIRAMSPGTR